MSSLPAALEWKVIAAAAQWTAMSATHAAKVLPMGELPLTARLSKEPRMTERTMSIPLLRPMDRVCPRRTSTTAIP